MTAVVVVFVTRRISRQNTIQLPPVSAGARTTDPIRSSLPLFFSRSSFHVYRSQNMIPKSAQIKPTDFTITRSPRYDASLP